MPQEKTTKEKLIEEFEKKYSKDFIIKSEPEDYIHKGVDPSFNISDVKQFISKAIDQTREETIREVEEMVDEITPAYIGVLESNNDRRYYEQGFGEYKEEIKQSLKSLINK